jgi:SARP family transcriptional regulator, regulator of embCAB operon
MSRSQAVSVQRQAAGVPALRVSLLGGFSLRTGGVERPLGHSGRRLLALLALAGQQMLRSAVAGMLWPEASEARASACLRSALARLTHAAGCLLCVNASQLSLDPAVRVDLREAQVLARQLVAGEAELSAAGSQGDVVERLSLDLLPGWYDDWVLIEAETWRQLRLHALEALSARLTAVGRHAEAILAALAAVSADPLRESPRSVLISAYLAEGNRSDALREFTRYQRLLGSALGVEPTPRLRALATGGAQLSRPGHGHLT